MVAVAPAQGAETVTVQTLHFRVLVGPNDNQVCDIIGDLYTPSSASPTNRKPALLATNGFGGSKDDQAGLAQFFAKRGYIVLSYSGLGFGGSDCKITLDDPEFDGKAGSQLVSYLAGRGGIAFTDDTHTTAAPRLRSVARDPGSSTDPVVGMFGGSYGGQIQFSIAAQDPRLDTIVPAITWHDLAYALGPNNDKQLFVPREGVSTTIPGAIKLNWGAGFSAIGVANGVENAGTDPTRAVGCPNFADFVCPALVSAGSTGFFQPDAVAALRKASVSSYLSSIRIPTLILQGQQDTLFNLNDGIATYLALKRQGTAVSMIWHSWGHSGPSAPGDFNGEAPSVREHYEIERIVRWFDRHLKGKSVSTGPEFSYFRDWVSYTGRADAAYQTASRYPVGQAQVFRLSGASDLVTGDATAGSQTFTTPAAGAPTSVDNLDVVGSFAPPPPTGSQDAPGTFASWQSGVLPAPLDVVGVPRVRLSLQAPTINDAAGPANNLVLFVKLLDVAPDGTASMIKGLEAPIRVADPSVPLRVRLPAIVHRFDAGHSLRLVVSGGSANYRGGLTPAPVTIDSGQSQRLILPVLTRTAPTPPTAPVVAAPVAGLPLLPTRSSAGSLAGQ